MVGNIYIVGQHLANGADNRVVTATSAYGMNGESGLTYNGSLLGVTGDIAVSTANRLYFGNSDVAWVKGEHGGSGYLELGVNTGHVRILRNGRVGIGTEDPLTQLTVAANSAQAIVTLKRTNSNGGSGSYGAINFAALDGHSVANMYALGDGNDEGAHLIFKTTSAAASNDTYNAATEERLRITSTGKVGVNQSTWSSKDHMFEVRQSTNDKEIARFSVDGGSGSVQGKGFIGLTPFNTVTYPHVSIGVEEDGNSHYQGNLTFATRNASNDSAPTERLRINSTGNVGIATDISGGGGAYGRLSVVIPSQSGGAALQVMNSALGSGDGSLSNIVLRSVNNLGTQWADAEFRAQEYIFKNQATEALRIKSTGQREIRNYHYGPWAFTNNTAKTTITVGDPGDNKFTTIKLILTLIDGSYRQNLWQGEYTIFASNAAGGPGVNYYLKEHWQHVGSGNWSGGTVSVAITSGGALQVTADNGHDDAAGNAYIHILDVIGDIDGTTVASISS
jgi:hypothetical protein